MAVGLTEFILTCWPSSAPPFESPGPLVFPPQASVDMKLLSHSTPSSAVPHLQRLAECLGIVCECDDIAKMDLSALITPELGSPSKLAVVVDVGSLKHQSCRERLAEFAARLRQCDANVLALVTEPGESVDQFVQMLTAGEIRGVASAERACHVSFSGGFSRELAGHSFAREAAEALSLNLASAEKSEVIMTLDQSPAFIHLKVGSANVFIWATGAVLDVLRPLDAEKEFELTADTYIPAIIFLRFAFGDRCWHNPNPGVGLVIDDPLLEKNYGFIDFCGLLESARRHKYHVTLAFIPWNYWRGGAAKARMFLDHSDCFSVCIHGCDHTNREFGSDDYEDLLGRSFLARQRMERLRERTGLVCEALMVCPQEQYSLEAVRAFADSRQFTGLICSASMPRNLTAPGICGADLLLPAQDSFFGFPVFKRYYWSDISIFAMALFLGKPAISVEHHEFFRKGCGGAESFVSEVSRIRPNIKWVSLLKMARRTHLRRQLSDSKFEVRFFTDEFELEHSDQGPAEYRLIRRLPATTLVRRVTVDGIETQYVQEGGQLTFGVQADVARVFQIDVDVPPITPVRAYSRGIAYHASVAVRRGLAEFRDKVIARNDFFLRSAKLLARTMKQTGD